MHRPLARRASVSNVVVGALFGLTGAALLAGCGPKISPEGPGEKATDDTPVAGPVTPARPPANEVLIGQMCITGASGRPGVMPLVARRVSWNAKTDYVAEVLERSMARQFSVFGWTGDRVGVFSVSGAADTADGTIAVGSYAGGSACVDPKAGPDAEPSTDCEKALLTCALAVAKIEPAGGLGARPFEEDAEPVTFPRGGGCAAKGNLVVDIDGDGKPEAFPARTFLDAMRAPAEEVSAVAAGGAACTPTFAARGVFPASDPRDWRGLDLLGVLDLDGDGRNELVLAYNYAGRKTWAIYSALSTPARLELVGEAVPFRR